MIDTKDPEIIQSELSHLYIRTKGNAAFVDPSYIYDYVEQLVELCYHISVKLYEQNIKIEDLEYKHNNHHHTFSEDRGDSVVS